MLLCEWAREFKMSRKTLGQRLARGWTLEDALNRPVKIMNSIRLLEAKEKGEKYYNAISCKNCGCMIRITKNSDCPYCKRENRKPNKGR